MRNNKSYSVVFMNVFIGVMVAGAFSFGFSQPWVKPLRFAVDSAFLAHQSPGEIKTNLAGYVDDINTAFSRSTQRRFSFNPETDLTFKTPPYGNGAGSPLNENYAFKAEIIFDSNGTVSSGGYYYGNIHNSNELVFGGMKWLRIYSRQEIDLGSLPALSHGDDYFARQLYPVVHELGHAHGLALGEYYNLASVNDSSRCLPDLSTKLSDPENYFWKRRPLVLNDPMFGYANGSRGKTILEKMKFSPLGAYMINSIASGRINTTNCPTLNFCFYSSSEVSKPVRITMHDSVTSEPLSRCSLFVFIPNSSLKIQWDTVMYTDHADTVAIDPGARFGYGSFGLIMFCKVHREGYYPGGDAISIFDYDAFNIMPDSGSIGDFRYPGLLNISLKPSGTPVKNAVKLQVRSRNSPDPDEFVYDIAGRKLGDFKSVHLKRKVSGEIIISRHRVFLLTK
jgi:hypothetical protein